MLFEALDIRAGYAGVNVVNGVSLSVDQGDALLLRGKNGCGKSTLLRALCGQVPRVDGIIRFRGRQVGCRPFDKAYLFGDVFFVTQTRHVFDDLSVAENFSIAAHGFSEGQLDGIPASMLAFVSQNLKTRAGLLSGGQKKLVALIMAWVSPASLLFLDEPLAGLSAEKGFGNATIDLLIAAQSRGRGLIIVEHRHAELMKRMECEARIRVVDFADGGFVNSMNKQTIL